MINHEAWVIAARGIFDLYLADIEAITSRDTRAAFIYRGFGTGRLAFRCWQTMDYVPSDNALSELSICIQDPVYKPRYREDLPPIPQNVVATAGVLTCDPVEGYTVEVFQHADDLFESKGELDGAAHPTGAYVLVCKDAGGTYGLPSGYILVP